MFYSVCKKLAIYALLYILVFVIHEKLQYIHRTYCNPNIIVYYFMKDSMMCIHLSAYSKLLQDLVIDNLSYVSAMVYQTLPLLMTYTKVI